MNTTGQRLQALREKLGISQGELAKRMGFSRNYISLVENGREPAHRFLKALELLEQSPSHYSEQYRPQNPFPGSPRARMRQRREELGLSLDELARRTGLQRSELLGVEEGHTRATEKMLRAISHALDIPAEELMGGSDYPYLAGAGKTFGALPNVETPPGMIARTIPQVAWAQAGTTQAWDDVYEHEGFVAFNVKDPKALAIQIRGDSMEPQYREGTIAIVYPSWEAKSGDLVIARLNDGTVMFKRLHVDGDKYTFLSLNPIYPPLTVDQSKIAKVLPVAMTQSPHML